MKMYKEAFPAAVTEWLRAPEKRGSWKRFLKAGLWFSMGVTVLFSGCASNQPNRLAERGTGPVLLAPGDVVRLSFPGAPEFNQAQKMRADGRMSLPVVGEVQASGKRLVDFQSELSARYRNQLQNTDVVVTLESSVTPVLVSGAVSKPGRIVVERPLTVVDVIMEAGGITELGNPKKVHVIRVEKGRHFTQVFDVRPILKGNAMDAFYVKGGDIVYVEERLF